MSEEDADQGDYKPMASTFHTPSFGDEDFNLLPSLTLAPSEGSTTDDNVFSMTSSVTSSSPSETMAPPLTSTPPCVTEYEPNPASSEPHPASSIPQAVTSHMVMAQNPVVTTTQMANMPMHHMNAYHQQPHHPQQTFQPHPNFYGQQMMDNHYHGNSHFLPKFPPPTFDIPDIQASLAGADNNNHNINNNNMHLVTTTVMATSQAMLLEMPPGHHGNNMPQPQAPPTHRGQRIITQMSPPGSNTTSPGRESSAEESSSDDSIPLAQLAQKRNAPAPPKPPAPAPAKKPRTPKKRKKKDPNEPQKPVSAYALFFRDTQAAIKTRNPNASFGEVSKIVASMWDGLEEDHKNDYKKRTETAKKEYLKQLAAYRATLVSKGALENGQDGGNAPVNQRNNTSPKNVAHNNNTSSPSLPPNPAAMTPAHHATSHPSMHHPPPPHLSQIAQMNGNGHMMQHYGMAPMMSPGHGTMGPPPPPHMMAPPGGGMSPAATRSPPEGIRMHDGYMAPQVHPSSPPMAMDSPGTAPSMCVRTGCGNPAIHSPGWDNEYCSNDCVVSHCRDAFTRWVATRQGNHSNTSYASVK